MKVSIQGFYQNYYDTQVFHQDTKLTIIDMAYDSSVRIDNMFSSVERDTFRQEMMAVRMELTGLAFQHIVRNDELLLAQSVFTKNYLRDNELLEIWSIMLEYNKVISKSSGGYVEWNRPLYRAHITMHNNIMLNKWKMFLKAHETDETALECAGRVCNRYTSEVAWERQFTHKYLVFRLLERVKCSQESTPRCSDSHRSSLWVILSGGKREH